VEYTNEIRTPSGGKKMMVQGMPEAIFLKNVGVGHAMLDTVAEVVADGRRQSGNGASRARKHEGNVRQTWKVVSSRSNHQVITGDVTLCY
jgi:hypothetical protein